MDYKLPRQRVVCKDKVSLSIQGSSFAYSEPRDNKGPYTQVEVGFVRDTGGNPMEMPESWREYADAPVEVDGIGVISDVYGYVPVEMVTAFIEEHGGIDVASYVTNI